jgi:hypothetical protein
VFRGVSEAMEVAAYIEMAHADAFTTQIWAMFASPRTCRSLCVGMLGWSAYPFFVRMNAKGWNAYPTLTENFFTIPQLPKSYSYALSLL